MRRTILSLSAFRPFGMPLVIIALLLAYSCGGHPTGGVASTPGTGSVGFSVKIGPPPSSAANKAAAEAMAAVDICADPYNVQKIDIEIWKDGKPDTRTEVVAQSDCTDNTARLENVPANIENLYVKIACTPGGWSGESARFKLNPGEHKNLGEIIIATQVAAPSFSPEPGTYSTTLNVTLSTTPSDATIIYTTDGTTPSETVGTVYPGTPISVSSTTTIRAVAYRTGWTTSPVSSATYTISTPTSCADATGLWRIDEVPSSNCGDDAPFQYHLGIAQTVCTVTATVDNTYGPFTGTIDGSTMSWSGSYPDTGGVTTVSIWNATLVGAPPSSLSGTSTWTWTDNVFSCFGTSTFSGVKLVDAPTFTLTVNATNGTVAKDPNQPSYALGTTVTLTATPAAGYTFANWSGDLTGSTNPATIVMNSNKTITASFSSVPPSNGIWDSSLWDDTRFVWGP